MHRPLRFYAGAMKEASDRLRELRIKKGFGSPSEAARAFGWNEHTYKSHENGIRGIRLPAARKYAAAYGSTPAYILTGSDGHGAAPSINQVIEVPLLGTVSAGLFREGDGLEFGESRVPAVPRRDIPAEAQYCLKIDGQSVNLRIPDGAYAVCAYYDRYPGGAQHGNLVHVIRERAGLVENTIKELRYDDNGPYLMPVSSDPAHQQPIRLNGDTEEVTIRIQGVVIGKFEPL